MNVEINNEGYCVNCEVDHNCINCDLMNIIYHEITRNEITRNKKKVFSIINKKEIQNKQNNPICFDCGKKMIKSKFKNRATYWCPCSKR